MYVMLKEDLVESAKKNVSRPAFHLSKNVSSISFLYVY